ncbi:MORN repeat protein [Opitutaceae bacterium TAV1]|nr:MORN repeat protein [Opitutaceae bacterium TAV1]
MPPSLKNLPFRFLGRLVSACVCLAITFPLASGQTDEIPEPWRSLPDRLRAAAETFPLARVSAGEAWPVFETVMLGNNAIRYEDSGRCFDAFRFRTPPAPESSGDMVWAFTAPRAWLHWYILPREGEMEGFRSWHHAVALHEEFPAATRENPVILQRLEGDRLKPDTEYILWFSARDRDAPGGELRFAIHFEKSDDQDDGKVKEPDDPDAIIKALRLQKAGARRQAQYLGSRGARLLLDTKLFEAGYGERRIDDLLTSLERTRRFRGGFFMTMEFHIPPCRSEPLLADIVKAYGEPDLMLRPEDFPKREDSDDGDEKEPPRDVYYFDYFGLEVNRAAGRVVRVRSQAVDLARWRQSIPAAGLAWSECPVVQADCTLFYRDGRELARVVSWGKPDARRIDDGGPLPKGAYASPDAPPGSGLVHEGEGRFRFEYNYADGTPRVRAKLVKYRWQGAYEEFFPNGSPKARMPYKDGELDGEARIFDESGKVVRSVIFEEGKRVDMSENAP